MYQIIPSSAESFKKFLLDDTNIKPSVSISEIYHCTSTANVSHYGTFNNYHLHGI